LIHKQNKDQLLLTSPREALHHGKLQNLTSAQQQLTEMDDNLATIDMDRKSGAEPFGEGSWVPI